MFSIQNIVFDQWLGQLFTNVTVGAWIFINLMLFYLSFVFFFFFIKTSDLFFPLLYKGEIPCIIYSNIHRIIE